METAIKELQIEIYRLDWRIGVAANDLKNDLENSKEEKRKNAEYYSEAVIKRQELVQCLEKLKSLYK